MTIDTDGDYDMAARRAEHFRQVAGAVAVHSSYQQMASWDVGLLFEHEGYWQVIRIRDEDLRRAVESLLKGMRARAIDLIYEFQIIPDGFDRWQNEGGR